MVPENIFEKSDSELPQWQKELIDARLEKIKNNPDCSRPIEELFEELDNDE